MHPPAASDRDRLLAALDDHHPTALEETSDGLRVFFTTAQTRDRAIASLALFVPPLTLTAIEVPDEGWAERSQSSLEPVQVGRFVISPRKDVGFPAGGDEKKAPDVLCTLFILPSMGFGTGHHASTRLCLRLLQAGRLDGASVLDVGTGSGVLAIAARRLGAGVVVATDIDSDALQSAQENLDLNQERGVELRAIDLATAPARLRRRFDVVLANLTGAVLARHAAALAALAVPGGSLIASGFQQPEADAVAAALDHAGWTLRSRLDEDDWVGAAFVLRPAATSPTRSTTR
jgi:ribosomal protein L11 methyltransferase